MKNSYNNLKFKASLIRQIIFTTAINAKKGHVPPAFSWVEIATFLFYSKKFNFFTNSKSADKFILSKGHGCLTLYAVLFDKGFINKKDLKNFAGDGSLLPGHPDTKINKIENCSGSLGHGIGVACGKAISIKLNNKKSNVFVLLGDGECQEGSVWESIIFAAQNKLDNLIIIIDYNKLGATDYIKNTGNLEPLSSKLRSFGCEVSSLNGHSYSEIFSCFKKFKKNGKPKCFIANTIKGKGVSFMENSKHWHHQLPSNNYIDLARIELGLKKII